MNDDLISRQAALEVLSEYYHHKTEIQHRALREALGMVPSAQPEIIRCKDCKHWTNNISDSNLRDYYCNEAAHGFHYRCSGYDYCSFAERKE